MRGVIVETQTTAEAAVERVRLVRFLYGRGCWRDCGHLEAVVTVRAGRHELLRQGAVAARVVAIFHVVRFEEATADTVCALPTILQVVVNQRFSLELAILEL